MKKKIMVVVGLIVAAIIAINGIDILDFSHVSAYENIVGGTYKEAQGIVGPDNRVYVLSGYEEVIVKDLNNEEIDRYSTGLKAHVDAVGGYNFLCVKVLECGEVCSFSSFDGLDGYSYLCQTNYLWSEADQRYVVKSTTKLKSGTEECWVSRYGFVLRGSDFNVYKFTSTGAVKLSGKYPTSLGGLYSGIYYDDYSLFLGNDNLLYCVKRKGGMVYKCTNGKWSDTGYLKSTYPNWKELVGINDIKLADGSSDEWHYKYSVNGKKYYAKLPWSKSHYLVNSEPVINETNPKYKLLSIDESTVTPKMYVTDSDNDNLTCKYYVDGSSTAKESKVVTGTSTKKEVVFGALSVSGWKEGTHTIKFEVSDAEKTIIQEVIINKVSASITEKADSITISHSGIDSEAKGKQFTYMYTVGAKSNEVSQKTYTKYSLTPNTTYAVNVEAKDELGNIYKLYTSNKSITTLAQKPKVKLSNPAINTLDLSVIDNNPSYTQYQITVGNKYVSALGSLTDTVTWTTLTNKKITLKGLTAGTTYQFRAKAKNSQGVETPYSNRVSGTTLN